MTETMTTIGNLPRLDYSPRLIVETALRDDRRVLLFGESGIGKSTLATALARRLSQAGRCCWCIDADPGSPTFGIPGAVCLGEWQSEQWHLLRGMEALCTLDAGRFRLPLVCAVRRLAAGEVPGVLIVDAPGVVRGVAGAEILTSLVKVAGIDVVLVLSRDRTPPLPNELKTLGAEVFVVQASTLARRPSKRARAQQRTRLWDSYLRDAEEYHVPFSDVPLVGTPPPVDVGPAWLGRQVALLAGHRTVAMGEVYGHDGDSLRVRTSRPEPGVSSLLVRDARRAENGLLTTVKPFASTTLQYIPPPDVRPYPGVGGPTGPCPVARVGAATATLINGIFGDPLLHLRLRHQKRSLLFDLGEGGRLPGRVAHQVTDVFISHAHLDHIGGFLWLLRSRMGDFPACRLYGPPGLAGHIAGLLSGIHWDRIGENGPRFEVAELHSERLVRFALQAGRSGIKRLGEGPVPQGTVLAESAFRVRAVTLDHGTPVLAFAFEQPRELNVRKDRLTAKQLPVGPWLGELKARIAADERDAPIRLPDGSVERAGLLGDELLLITPGEKLVYATDLADTAENRERLTALARDAHTFFCEASFAEADKDQARRTGHLTARACGEIAAVANVERLVPFHFSRRYEKDLEKLYDEIRSTYARLIVPK